MPRSSRTTVTGADRPGRLREPSCAGNGRRTTITVPTKATTRTTTRIVATPKRLSRSTRRRDTVGTLTPRGGAFRGRRGGCRGEGREVRRDERGRPRRGPPARLGRAPGRRRGGPDQRPQLLPEAAALLRAR